MKRAQSAKIQQEEESKVREDDAQVVAPQSQEEETKEAPGGTGPT